MIERNFTLVDADKRKSRACNFFGYAERTGDALGDGRFAGGQRSLQGDNVALVQKRADFFAQTDCLFGRVCI